MVTADVPCVLSHAHALLTHHVYLYSIQLTSLWSAVSNVTPWHGRQGGRAGNTRGNDVSLTHAHKRAHGCGNTALLWQTEHFLIFLSPAAEPQGFPNRNSHIFVMTDYRKKYKLFLCNYDNTLILSVKLPAELQASRFARAALLLTSLPADILIWQTQSSDPLYFCFCSVVLQPSSPSRFHTVKRAF